MQRDIHIYDHQLLTIEKESEVSSVQVWRESWTKVQYEIFIS